MCPQDANAVDLTTPEPKVVSIVATPTATSIKFNGAGTQVLNIDSWGSALTGQLKVKPVSGGVERVLDGASLGSFPAPTGTGVLSAHAHRLFGIRSQESFALGYVDSVAGGAVIPAGGAVYFNAYYGVGGWSGPSLVYLDPTPGSAGLYTVAVP